MNTTLNTTPCSAPAQVQSTQDGQESSSFPLTPAVFGWAWTKTFKLPSLPYPPSVNHYWLRNKNGSVRVSAEGKAYREAVQWRLRKLFDQPLKGLLAVDILVDVPDRRRRDLDNMLKAILDALTASGVWVDDCQVVDLRIRKSQTIGGCIEVTVWE